MNLFEDIHNIDIEEKPGLYTFFYRPVIENFDLYTDDDELGAKKIIEIIDERFIYPLCNKVIDVSFSLDFEQSLNGGVKSKHKSINEKRFNSKLLKNNFSASNEFQNLSMREAFQEFMQDISFYFNRPIYIGVSHNVKERLLDHYESFFNAKNLIIKSAEVSDDDFGSRAALFANENEIYFTYQYIESNKLNKEKSYKMALMMEWILNQQNTPTLGRK